MDRLIKPYKLNPGDRVATISMSWGGAGSIPHKYAYGKKKIQKHFDVEVVETKHALRDAGWIAKNPEARAADLMEALLDDKIHAIISNIGGEDSIRCLPFMDLDIIRNNPKIFMGFSDTTVTHLAFYTAGVTSFYGPSVLAGLAEPVDLFPYTVASMREELFSNNPSGEIPRNMAGWTNEFNLWEDERNLSLSRKLFPAKAWNFIQGEGKITGHLFGGCLEVLDWLRGSPVFPETKSLEGAMLFFETSEEQPKPSDFRRMLRNLGAMGVLKAANGILLGRPYGESFIDEYDQVLKQVIVEELGLTDKVIVTGLDFGHSEPMMTLPYGVEVEVDCEGEKVRILESGVV